MTAQEAFEKWREGCGYKIHVWGPEKSSQRDAFLCGIQHQENQQLLCLAEIREVLGDKEGKLNQEEVVQRVRDLVESAYLPKEPSLSMLEAGWGICGTELSSMEPDPKKIRMAESRYEALFQTIKSREESCG